MTMNGVENGKREFSFHIHFLLFPFRVLKITICLWY